MHVREVRFELFAHGCHIALRQFSLVEAENARSVANEELLEELTFEDQFEAIDVPVPDFELVWVSVTTHF